MASFLSSFSVLNVVLNAAGYILNNKPVALYDSHSQEVLEDCSIISCSIQDKARLMEHPLESGAKITDHKIFEPRTFNLQIALPPVYYENAYQTLFNLYRNSEILTLQTKAQIYENLQISGIPHEEKANNINRMIFNIELKEAQIVTAIFITAVTNVAKPANTSTVNTGQQQPKSSSLLYQAFGGLF